MNTQQIWQGIGTFLLVVVFTVVGAAGALVAALYQAFPGDIDYKVMGSIVFIPAIVTGLVGIFHFRNKQRSLNSIVLYWYAVVWLLFWCVFYIAYLSGQAGL